MKQRAFTLVEILVAISILATISIVAYVSVSGHMKIANNATRISTIDSLHLSLSDYYQLKKVLPEPDSNYIAYDERGTYMHSLSGAYGVSGHVSDSFLPAGYVNFSATDPESNQFYGYGKLTDNTAFDVASVLYDEKTGGYKTYIRGTYEKQRLSSLIRAYSSSNFISQDSTEDLPYNPYERKVTAYVSSYSGTLTIKDSKGGSTVLDSTLVSSFTGELNSGDSVILSTGSTALLHISDGSELSLGSATSQTELSLDTLAYNGDNNLASKVALYLKSGEVWTEAPHLRSEADSASDFSIQTDSAVAAVRGTVFGVAKNPLGITTLSLDVGKLEVSKRTGSSSIPFYTNDGFSDTATGGFVLDNAKSYMVVPEGGQPIKLDGISIGSPTGGTSTGSLNPFEIDQKIQHPPFSLGYRPRADRISFTHTGAQANTDTGILSVTFQNYGVDSYELYFGSGEMDPAQGMPVPGDTPSYTGSLPLVIGPVTITGAFVYNPDPQISRVYSLKVCFHSKCSAPDIQTIVGSTFSIDHFKVWGEKKPKCLTGFSSFPPFGCQPDNLVAYAPYDRDSDLNLYGRNKEPIAGSGAGILNRPLYRGYDTALNAFNTIDGSTRPGTYPSDLFKSQYNSFYQWGDTKGILVATASGGTGTGSLQYDLAPLNLSGSHFAIEMRVRGGALNRTDSQSYYMWDDGNGGVALRYQSNVGGVGKFTLESRSYYLVGTNNNCLPSYTNFQVKYFCSNTNTPSFNNTTFYTILTEFKGNIISLFVDGQPVGSVGIDPTKYFTNQRIFIGNRPGSGVFIGQWNDIIDSVKVFSLP
ncbi:MAG: FecR domain-containing protein [Candidatus Gracilibacteria bacterium]|nr:FecR domain-containing protein [Candidatus Gracilibacteria bacterium]